MTMDNTEVRYRSVKNEMEAEMRERVESLLEEKHNLEANNADLDSERRSKRQEWKERAAKNSDRLAAIDSEIQSLMPTNPIPPQRIAP